MGAVGFLHGKGNIKESGKILLWKKIVQKYKSLQKLSTNVVWLGVANTLRIALTSQSDPPPQLEVLGQSNYGGIMISHIYREKCSEKQPFIASR